MGYQIKGKGAIPSQILEDMINKNFISCKKGNINPASFDLSISKEIYRVNALFQPKCGEPICDLLEKFGNKKYDLNYPLEKDVIYIARLNEKLDLPKGIYGFVNPKSSTGRLDVFVRVLADGTPKYDAIPDGYNGDMWISIIPKSFPIEISEGERLSQVRLFTGDTRLNETELKNAFKKYNFLWNTTENRALKYDEIKIRDNDGSITLTVDLNQKIIGYKCNSSKQVLDLSKRNFYKPEDFFEPIKRNDNTFITLEKDKFYILSTLEAVKIPPRYAANIVAVEPGIGEFRNHYAGYVDSGFGWGKKGTGKGSTLTLEVRSFEDVHLRHNQPIAKIIIEKMCETPEKVYDTIPTSNYIAQFGPKLSKHFMVQT